MAQPVERNLGFDLVRVTETAAIGAARWLGRGDKEAVDQAAVDGMRLHLSSLDIDGVVVIGEGEKDQAPMLYNGEKVGTGNGIEVAVAVDPVDGTTLTASGVPGAIAVIAIAEGQGSMFAPGPLVYMDKIAVGPEARGAIDVEAPVEHNLRQIARSNGKSIGDLRALILDRPRNEHYIDAIRKAGARISLLRDGDVAAAIATAQEDHEADVLLGIGGSPEAVIAAAALKCMGGEIQCRLWPRDADERTDALGRGLSLDETMTTDDLVSSDNVFFAATGVTGGDFLRAVQFTGEERVTTHSVIMRSKTRSVRYMQGHHNLARLRDISSQLID